MILLFMCKKFFLWIVLMKNKRRVNFNTKKSYFKILTNTDITQCYIFFMLSMLKMLSRLKNFSNIYICECPIQYYIIILLVIIRIITTFISYPIDINT